MKIKVLKRFHDKVNDKVYEVGEVVEVTDKRGIEIISNPLELAEKISGADVTAAAEVAVERITKTPHRIK